MICCCKRADSSPKLLACSATDLCVVESALACTKQECRCDNMQLDKADCVRQQLLFFEDANYGWGDTKAGQGCNRQAGQG